MAAPPTRSLAERVHAVIRVPLYGAGLAGGILSLFFEVSMIAPGVFFLIAGPFILVFHKLEAAANLRWHRLFGYRWPGAERDLERMYLVLGLASFPLGAFLVLGSVYGLLP